MVRTALFFLARATVVDWPVTPPIRADADASAPPDLRFRAFQAAARRRLERGVALLSSGRRIVTDRLHGHILSLLLGRPHRLVDNCYGKLSSFVACWTEGAPGLDPEILSPAAVSTGAVIGDRFRPARKAAEG